MTALARSRFSRWRRSRSSTSPRANVPFSTASARRAIRVSKTGTVTSPIGYAGGYHDAETGLNYLIHRYYDPTTGQFMTVDPLVAQTMVPYVYGGNNSVNENDPTGELSGSSEMSAPLDSSTNVELPGVPGGIQITLADSGANDPKGRIEFVAGCYHGRQCHGDLWYTVGPGGNTPTYGGAWAIETYFTGPGVFVGELDSTSIDKIPLTIRTPPKYFGRRTSHYIDTGSSSGGDGRHGSTPNGGSATAFESYVLGIEQTFCPILNHGAMES